MHIIKILTRFKLSVSCNIDNFLKHSVEDTVDTHADVTATWVPTSRILLSISALTIRHHLFLWVPLSESVHIFIVLDLLSHNSRSRARAVMESYSILANMGINNIIITSRGVKVFVSKHEAGETSCSHSSLSIFNCLLSVIVPRYVLLCSS